MQHEQLLRTPIGTLRLIENGSAITDIKMSVECPDEPVRHSTPLLQEACSQLEAYFPGSLIRFDLPLAPQGTPYEQRVWEAIRQIPYGTTASYGQIASRIGNPQGARSIGRAAHRNPILIVIPCHRILGANGSLTGYAGGLAIKEALLHLERQSLLK